MSQPSTGPKNSADAVRRVLTTAGITGAAFTLSAAAALPAFACHGGGKGDDSKQSSTQSSQSTQSSHQSKGSGESKDSESHDTQATKTSSDSGDKGKSDEDKSDKSKSGEDKGDNGGSDKSQGANGDEGHNPPGNNGTVKIHQTAGDSSPHNQPHVTCSFYVSFFGFDKNQTLNIAFAGQAPTGKDTPIAITDASKRSLTSTTDAGGAGNDYDGDQGASYRRAGAVQRVHETRLAVGAARARIHAPRLEITADRAA